ENYDHAHKNLARLLGSQGKPDEAIAHLKKAIEIDPKFAPYHIDLARVFETKKQFSETIVELGTAIQLDPGDGFPHALMGHIRGMQGWPEAELARYRKASAIG